jgi:ubiquinone/menaquinone biosynthesis C-methylase UbiE
MIRENNEYWAQKTYSKMDPITYERIRFEGIGGKAIDAVEKAVVANLLSIKSGERILDLGAGTGRLAFLLHQKGASVVALDVSPNMLRIAKSKAVGKQKNEIEFVLGDAYNLPFIPEAFDAVVSLRVFAHLPNKVKVLNEIYRVLKIHGSAILDYFNMYSLLLIPVIRQMISASETFALLLKRLELFSMKNLQRCVLKAKLRVKKTQGAFLFGMTPYYVLPKFFVSLLCLVDRSLSNNFIAKHFSTRVFSQIVKRNLN